VAFESEELGQRSFVGRVGEIFQVEKISDWLWSKTSL